MSGSRRRPTGGSDRERGGRGGATGGHAAPKAAPGGPAPTGPPAPESVGRGTETEARSVNRNRHRALALAGLVGLVPGVVVAVVLVLAGQAVVAVAALVVVACGTAWWTWRSAPGRVARAVGARPSEEVDHPRLHNLVDGLCASMGLSRPTIFVVEHDVPNAMAVGRDASTACLIVTSGLEQALSLVQLEGVLAHELVHVKRGDIVLAGMAAVALAPWSLVVGVSRAGDQVHALVGPGREFTADQRAAAVVRYPPGIGSALEMMAERPGAPAAWPPGEGRTAALTRWLWIDPMVGAASAPGVGNLDDTRVRAEAQSLL